MSRHFWIFINCAYWHFRHVAWYFVELLSQFKYDFFLWELHQLSKALRIMPGCLLLVIPLWHLGCVSVHFGSDPVTPRAPLREINEGSCNNGDQGQHEVLGSIPLWQGRKFHHVWWQLGAFLFGNLPSKLHLGQPVPLEWEKEIWKIVWMVVCTWNSHERLDPLLWVRFVLPLLCFVLRLFH